MSQLPLGLGRSKTKASPGPVRAAERVGVVDDALGGPDRLAAMAALFPHAVFERVGPDWPHRGSAGLDILITAEDAYRADETCKRLHAMNGATRVVVVLHQPDVATMRRLSREGAADVLPAPVNELAVAACLERLLHRDAGVAPSGRKGGEVVALLKAGGGVGATCLGVQVAAILAQRNTGPVCFADLDLQSGAASVYLDLPEAMTLTNVLGLGAGLSDSDFGALLARHRSGARLLAAPQEMTPLDALKPAQASDLVDTLRRDFELTLIDLPPVWTAWTHLVLSKADRIVLVTQLSVPHIQLVMRQLRFLSLQKLDSRPIILVCNALTKDQLSSVPLKVAEKSLGRPYDVVIPEDRRTMTAAINQGVPIAAVRRGTKVEQAIAVLADKVTETVQAGTVRKWK